MNKRQYKKLKKNLGKQFFKKQEKAVVNVDLTHVSDGSKIDIYISNKFECTSSDNISLENTKQKRFLSSDKHQNKGFGYYANIFNGFTKKVTVELHVADVDRSYYVIRPIRLECEN